MTGDVLHSAWIVFVFVAYFAVLIGIAIVRVRNMSAMSDYVLGRRRLSSFTTALSAGSSTTSGWTMLVFPALAFTSGANQLWLVVFLVIGAWINWTIVAKRLRRYTISMDDSLTLPEFLERRLRDETKVLRTISAAFTIFFIVFYITSGLVAGSKLLNTQFGLDATLGLILTLIAVSSYTFIGGFLAVSRTDVFQALLILVGFVIMLATVIIAAEDPLGGVGGGVEGFMNPLTDTQGQAVTPVFVIGMMGWGLGFFGAQHVLQRFMAVEREDMIKQSRNLSTLWLCLVYSLSFLLGLFARPALDEAGITTRWTRSGAVYFLVAEYFFPAVIGGLLLTAVIAAVMSTADSQLLLSSAIAAGDLPLLRRFAGSLDASRRVWLGRGLLVVIGALAAYLAIAFPATVLNLVAYAWGGMGATFGPAVLLALYWRRFNVGGALAGVVVGFVVASLWQFVLAGGPQGMFDIMPALPGFLAGGLSAVVATLLTAPPAENCTREFDGVVHGGLAEAQGPGRATALNQGS